MNLSTNQRLIALGILLAAIICAHVFAPSAVAAVISVATTVVGTLFVNKPTNGAPQLDEEGKPALRVINGNGGQ